MSTPTSINIQLLVLFSESFLRSYTSTFCLEWNINVVISKKEKNIYWLFIYAIVQSLIAPVGNI